jgi:hypothetical protein
VAASVRALCAYEEHAQNGRGVKLAAQRASGFLSSLAARSRALCAFKQAPVEALPRGLAIPPLC